MSRLATHVWCSGSPLGLSKQDETPAEKRARAALEKAQNRELAKQAESNSKLAELVLGKCGPTIVSLSALLEKDGMLDLPSIIRDPLVAALEMLQSLEASAKAIIAAAGEGVLELTDMKDPCCNCTAIPPPSIMLPSSVCSGFRSCPI
jgi:hypothetical protein